MAREEKLATVHTVLGQGALFEGKLSFEGEIRIEGHFKGEVRTADLLVVGETAKVEAELKVGTIIVNGEVHGNIEAAKLVELHHPARVYGNIKTPSLQIQKGVIFEGSTQMQPESAKAAAPAPAKG